MVHVKSEDEIARRTIEGHLNYEQRMQGAEFTNSPACPSCGKKLSCEEHKWANQKWFKRLYS